MFGNFLTSTVAIDAHSFGNAPEKQYEPEMILRELNKAYAGYSCLQDRGDISTELIALSVQGPTTAYIAECYSDHTVESSSDDTLTGNLKSSSSVDPNVHSGLTFKPGLLCSDFSAGAPPLSPIKELSETSVYANITDSIIKGGVFEAAKSETDKQRADSVNQYAAALTSSLLPGVTSEPETAAVKSEQAAEEKNQAINDFASNLTSSLFGGVQSKATPLRPAQDKAEGAVNQLAANIVGSLFERVQADTETGKEGECAPKPASEEAGGGIDQFAARMASSLFNGTQSDAETTPAKDMPPSTKTAKSVESLASSLSTAILKTSMESLPPSTLEGDDKQPTIDDGKAEKLAKSIITDVFSTIKPPPSPESSTKTLGEPTSQSLSSYSEQVANNIVTNAFYTAQPLTGRTSDHPAIFIQVERRGSLGLNESPRSSRSSSLTGQSITVHEFTDELAENLIRDGLSIAQFTSQSLDLQAPPREEEVEAVAEKITQSIVDSVKESSQKAPPLVLSPTEEEQPASLPEQDPPPPLRKVLRNRLLFSKQELAIVAARMAKRGSITDMSEHSDTEGPTFQLNPRLLTPSSSRHSMGYAWSTASTRDEGSRPVSPTDLDRIALGLATDTDEYAHIFAKILVSDAVLSVCGERPKKLRQGQIGEQYALLSNVATLPSENKIDSFLSRLEQMEVLSQCSDDALTQTMPTLQQKIKTVFLRPIATGNWGCGAFKGSPQFKCMLQFVVASMCERPLMIYFTHSNEEVKDVSYHNLLAASLYVLVLS